MMSETQTAPEPHDASPPVAAEAEAEAGTLAPGKKPRRLVLTRFLILRLLGVIYTFAFLALLLQAVPLIGHDGLLPADAFLDRVRAAGWGFFKLPSIFWLGISDDLIRILAAVGVALGALCAVGVTNAILLFVLWALYLSFVHVGQLWTGYGWDILLCEAGFLAIFLAPPLDLRPIPRHEPPRVVIWLYRWLAFRIMLGAGLIKLRGDPCWRDLTCLDFHFETQPLPNPLSAFFHAAPEWVHRAGVVFNHLAEVLAPALIFTSRRLRHIGALIMLAFQVVLILSGNLAFLNWLTIVPILACFDDDFLQRLLPRALVGRAQAATKSALGTRVVAGCLAALVGFLSIAVVENLLSSQQRMNSNFEPFELVNTYGAFGSVGRVRDEIIFEGTREAHPGPDTSWIPYEWKCKPGDPTRRPCWVSPYHLRLDWQIWFAAMEDPDGAPWTVHLVWKLLHGDGATLGLLDKNPFPDGPPRWIRARLYRYQLTPPGAPAPWRRSFLRDWLPALSVDTPALHEFLHAYGWQ